MRTHHVAHLLLAALACVPACGRAQALPPAALPAMLQETLACVSGAAEYHGVNPWVLRAILKVESDFNRSAFNRNANGTFDVGMAQINSIHFRELAAWGIAPAHLLDGCVAAYVAAWHLAKQIRAHGNSWFAVASYHSTSRCQNSRYAGLVWNALVGWNVVPGPKVKGVDAKACASPRRGDPSRPSGVAGASAPALAFDEAR